MSSLSVSKRNKRILVDDLSDATLFDFCHHAEPSSGTDDGILSNAQAERLLETLAGITRDADTIAHISSTEELSSLANTQDRPAKASELPPSCDTPVHSSARNTPSGKPMPELPPKGSIAALGKRCLPAAVPKRIGSGRLVPARLTWRPGDPFAARSATGQVHRFRWDTMLKAAGITTACGIGCLWILRSLLA